MEDKDRALIAIISLIVIFMAQGTRQFLTKNHNIVQHALLRLRHLFSISLSPRLNKWNDICIILKIYYKPMLENVLVAVVIGSTQIPMKLMKLVVGSICKASALVVLNRYVAHGKFSDGNVSH